jgi:hypothetical protein
MRLVIDYRAVNLLTKRNAFHIPYPETLFEAVSGSQWFSKLDLSHGFYQIRLHGDDQDKSTIITRYGNYKFLVMPMGICNAPSVYQRIVHELLMEYTDVSCLCYIDDILIYTESPDPEAHAEHLRAVLQKLREGKMYLNPEKAMLFQKRTIFLGHEIAYEGITSSVEKVEAVKEFAIPESVKDVRQFLGLTSYYRKFIHKYATIAGPLYMLLEGNGIVTKTGKIKAFQGCIKDKWRDDPSYEKSFNDLKDALTSAPVLRWPDFSCPFVVTPDASSYAIGGVIEQDVDGEGLRPVVYESRKMQGAEKNYLVHEQELLAILHMLKKFRHLLLGSKITIRTDHAPLKYLKTHANLSLRQQRWIEFLAPFDYDIIPIPGTHNTAADALSRDGRLCTPVHVDPETPVKYYAQIVDMGGELITTLDVSEEFHAYITSVRAEFAGGNDLGEVFDLTSIIPQSIDTSSEEIDECLVAVRQAYAQDKLAAQVLKSQRNSSVSSPRIKPNDYVVLNGHVYFYKASGRYLLYIPEKARLQNKDGNGCIMFDGTYEDMTLRQRIMIYDRGP